MDCHEYTPLTRLLLDSNFVSITDMIVRNQEGVQHTQISEKMSATEGFRRAILRCFEFEKRVLARRTLTCKRKI